LQDRGKRWFSFGEVGEFVQHDHHAGRPLGDMRQVVQDREPVCQVTYDPIVAQRVATGRGEGRDAGLGEVARRLVLHRSASRSRLLEQGGFADAPAPVHDEQRGARPVGFRPQIGQFALPPGKH
jgi:hypothetical protein